MPELKITLDTEQLWLLQHEAQRRHLTPDQLIQAILREQLPPLNVANLADSLPLPLWRRSERELIDLLESSDPWERSNARKQLQSRGTGAFDALEQGLTHPNPVVGLTAAELIVEASSLLALRPLLIAYSQAEAVRKPVFYQKIQILLEHHLQLPDGAWRAIHLCTLRTAPLISQQIKTTLNLALAPKDRVDPVVFRESATVAEIASLTALLRWQRTGDVARQVASVLNQIALSAPVPQLREALPLLHPAWHIRLTHPELVEALRNIEAATAHWKDLPLLAGSGDEVLGQDLPVPVE